MIEPTGHDVEIHLLGAPRWCSRLHGNRQLSLRDAALFALLSVEGESARDRVAAWLWPDSALKNANINLRQHLFKLRRTCGHPLVEAGPTLRLAAGVWVDVLDSSASGAGDLLAGLDFADFGAFADWLTPARRSCARLRHERLMARISALESRQELAQAILLAEQVVQDSPLLEHGWRCLIRLHYRRGDRAAAIHGFERCEQVLRTELGARPGPETVELLHTVERLAPPAAPLRPLPAVLLHPPRMVGRQGAMDRLRLAWNCARAVLVLGEGGLGKTRLLEEFARGQSGLLAHRARPGESAAPYATAALLLRELVARHRPLLDDETRGELTRLLPSLGTAPPGNGLQTLLWHAFESALRAACTRGLVGLAIDDLHLADRGSIELFRWLAGSPHLRDLRLVFAARGAEPDTAHVFAEWAADSGLETVRLEPLTAQQVHELLVSLALDGWGEGAVATDQARRLFRHAGGHPFHTLETLRLNWLGGPAEGLTPSPPSALAMIDHQLQRLSPAARELAAQIALAGVDWPPEGGVPGLQQPAPEVASAWAELEAAHLVQGGDLAHDLVRERARHLMPAAWQRQFHGHLAAVLSARADAEPARVAMHWMAAQAWPQAAVASREAASLAARQGRLEEQEALLDQCADAAHRGGDTGGRFAALADAASVSMMRLGGESAWQRLRDLQNLAQAPAELARAWVLLAEHHFNAGRLDQVLRMSEQAMTLAGTRVEVRHDARVLHGRALALTGQGASGVQMLSAAARSAGRRCRPDQELTARAGLAHALHAVGRPGEAVRVQQRVLALATDRRDRAEMAHAASNLSTLAYSLGDVELGLGHARLADALFRAMHARSVHWLWNAINLARFEAADGGMHAALEALAALDDADRQTVDPTVLALGRVTQALVFNWLGRPDLALTALPGDDEAVQPMVRARLHAQRACALSNQGLGSERELAAEWQAVDRLADRYPGLRDDGGLALDWASQSEPRPGAHWPERLLRLAALARGRAAVGLARSLELCRLKIMLPVDRVGARRLAARLFAERSQRLHAGTCPADAWATLSQALPEPAAAECRERARSWLLRVRLPEPARDWRAAFRAAHPQLDAGP